MGTVGIARPVYSVAEAADYLGVTPKSIRLWITQGRLDSFRAGRLIRIHDNQLKTFMVRNGMDPAQLDQAAGTTAA